MFLNNAACCNNISLRKVLCINYSEILKNVLGQTILLKAKRDIL